MVKEAERGLADFRWFIAEFQRRYEALRRYFTEDPSKLDEEERRRLEGEVKRVAERLNEAVGHFAAIDKAPRARIVSALNVALQRTAEGAAPQIPRDASVEDVVKHLALIDFGLAVKALRSAEKLLEAHYAVAPTRYDTRQIAAEVVKWKIEEQLPTLKLAGAARGIVLGGRSAEEGRALLKAWEPRPAHGLRLAIVGNRFGVVDVYEESPWEAVARRFSYLHELDVRKAVRITPDVFLTAERARYLAGFRAEEGALEALRKAVEYRRIMHMLERAEELRLTPHAVERLTADAERLRREVLQETAEIFRKFREEFFFVKDLLEGRRVIRREVPEVREVVKAFEDALAEALRAPVRRERLFREAFMERVERLAEEYARRGDVEGVERIRRAAGELAKISETVGWGAVEDVALVMPTVGRAFEEAIGESKDALRFAEAFKAKAEEAARQLERQGMRDIADRVRKAAERIAEEVHVGGWGAVERLRPLLSPEYAGDVLGRLEFLHSFFTTEAFSMYRELIYLQQVEELVKEVKGAASAPAIAEEALLRAAEAVPAVKDAAEGAVAALRAGRLAEAAEGLLRARNATEVPCSQAAWAASRVEEAVALGRRAEAINRRISELLSRAEALNADAIKLALEAAANRYYGRALALVEAAERTAKERLAAAGGAEPLAKALERLGVEAGRLGSPKHAVREVEKVAETLRALADLPAAVQRVGAEKATKAAEAFGLAETASLFRAVERVRKEARDAYPVFVKALAEALKAQEGERAEAFRRVLTAEVEAMAKAFGERSLNAETEGLRRAAEAALKIAESVDWRAPEEVAQRLPLAVEEAERLAARLRDEAAARQIYEYGRYSALASLAGEAGEAVVAKLGVEERLAKLIDDIKPAVELVAPHLMPLLERLKAGDYSVSPAIEAELPKLAERHRQLDELVNALEDAKKWLEKALRIGEEVKELEKALRKAPKDVRAAFGEALKALKRGDLERASEELGRILEIIEERRARLEPLEEEVKRAREAAGRLGLSDVLKALERPEERNAAKALGELERESAKIYGALELAEYVKRPRADADLGHAWAVARMLGLEETDRLFKALSETSLFLLREGREVFRNPLYDEVKHLVDQEWVRSLVRAPMYSYIIDKLGPDVLQPIYARWHDLFADYGPYLATAFEHARTSAVKAGAPAAVAGGFSYSSKMMRWLGDFSSEAVMRSLKAYYRGERRPFRELSEMTIIGAKIQLFDKAASPIMAKAMQMLAEAEALAKSDETTARRLAAEAQELKLLASVLRAKVAYEEVRLAEAYLRGARRRAETLMREAERERDADKRLALEAKAGEALEAALRKAERYLADARARYKAYLAEVRDFVKGHDVRDVGMKYFGLTARAFAGDPQEVAGRMVRAVDVKRVISWIDELDLPKELGEIAVRIADAERIYAKFEKILSAKAEPIPPVYDLEKAGRFFSDAELPPPPPRSRLEEAVAKAVKDVSTAYYAKLKNAAERAAVYLALFKGDMRHASREARRAYQALQKALKAKDKEEALKALEELKAALRALGIETEGGDAETVLKAVEEKLKPAYEEYLNARREFADAVNAIAKFSPQAALALGEAAGEGGSDSISRWMALAAYAAKRRALKGYARFWARPLEERWDSLPQAVREIVARRGEEAVHELIRNTLRRAGIGVGADMDLEGLEKALERLFTANGEWPDMRDYVGHVVETARRVLRGEADTKELVKAVDSLLAAYGARAAWRFVRSDRLEDAVDEMREGMRHYARGTGLKVRREAAERALLLGLSTMPRNAVEWYARNGWRGRLEPYMAYWTEDGELARRAGLAGWEIRQIKRPVSFEEGVPKEWRTAYVVAPFGFDFSAVERAVVEYVDRAEHGFAYVRPAEWPVHEAFLWFVLRDRQPVRGGEWITAFSIDRFSIEEPLAKFREALRARNFDEMRKIVRELYEAWRRRTMWQIVYEFDRERAGAALKHLKRRYGDPESRLWERYGELYLTWLAFRLADEYADYLRRGAGRGLGKEEVAGAASMPWLPHELAPAFMRRLVGDEDGWGEFRAAWITAVNKWFEGMAEPYTPEKPAVARRALELFNAFVGARLRYEELFPPPKPEAKRPATEAQKPEAAKPVRPAAEAKPAQRPAVGKRGLRREVEKLETAKPGAVEPESEPQPADRGLRRSERPRAPVADVVPERVFEAVDYLLGRFGLALDREAAFEAEDFVIVPDAEYRIKQFVLEIIDILARTGERYRRYALKGISTVEKALKATALAGFSAAAAYSVYHGLYSEAVVSSVASAVVLAEAGQFTEAAERAQRAAKALYETAKGVFERVNVSLQRLVELFVEAVARVLAWVDEHKAYLFLMAAAAAGVIALSVALNIWGAIELEKLACAASLTPFVPAGVEEYSREEAFSILRRAPDPYEKFKEIAKKANAGRIRLAEPWESLRMLIMPKPSEERRLGKAYRELNERKRKALFYAVFALEETFGVYRPALKEVAEGLREVVQRVEVGEGPFKRAVYMPDLGRLRKLAKKEEAAFEDALSILRERLNEYAVRHGLGGLLNVDEGAARRLAEAEHRELSELNDVNFGVKAYAALIAYREHALGRRGAFGIAAWHWLEAGGSAWLLYYTPYTAYLKAERAKAERPVTVEWMAAEALRRLFLKPSADHHSRFVEELAKGGRLALELEEAESSYVFRLYRLEEGGRLKELGVKLRIAKVGEGIAYALELDARWQESFKQELEAAEKAAEVVGGRLLVEDPLPYMLGWLVSDVAISRMGNKKVLEMATSHLWQLAETHALFGWFFVTVLGVDLTLEGPKPQFHARTPLEKLDEAIRRSAEDEWLKMLGVKAEGWDGLKRWVAERWSGAVEAAARQLGGGVRGELEALRDRLNDDKTAREVIAPALLLMQAERLGVNETTLKYFAAVISGAIGGGGHASKAMKRVELASGEREIALLWAAALAAYGIKTKIEKAGSAYHVTASGDDAVKLAGLYFLYGPSLLEGMKKNN